jgi:GNAT superfamily N-acetyltransferase
VDYLIERFDISQISQLKILFQAVYNKNSLDLEGLDDRFQTAQFGADCIGYIAYATEENLKIKTPAAYYGVFPVITTSGGKKIMCAQSGDTMTHPHHRKRGLFTKLARKTYETAREEGFEFIYGFPSPQAYPGFKHKLNWEFPYNMVKFTRIVPTLPIGIVKKKLNMKIGTFNKLVNKYVKVKNLCPPILSDQWYINNYAEFETLRDKTFWEYKNSLKSNKLFMDYEGVGALLKFDGNISIGNIIGDTSEESLKKLFKAIDIIAILSGSPQIRTFIQPSSNLRKSLNNYGKLTEAMPYGYINLTKKYDPSKLILDYVDFDYF